MFWEHLFDEKVIVGIFFTIGVFILTLQRFGVIKMPISRNSVKNGRIDTLEKGLLLQVQIVEQHERKFEKGEKKFEKLEIVIGKINTNVGILLDRTERRGVER